MKKIRITANGKSLLLSIDSDDEQDARSEELKALNLTRIAKEVQRCRSCRTETSFSCKRRHCPGCSTRRAKRNFNRILPVISRMKNPQLLLFTLRSRSLDDARSTVLKLRRDVVAASRCEELSWARTAIGGLHLKLTHDGRAWNAHCHLVADGDDQQFEMRALAKWWKDRSHDQGSVHADGPVSDVARISTYLTDVRGWSPASRHPPGSETLAMAARLNLLEQIWVALRGVHLVVAWGLKKNARVIPNNARSEIPSVTRPHKKSPRRGAAGVRKRVSPSRRVRGRPGRKKSVGGASGRSGEKRV